MSHEVASVARDGQTSRDAGRSFFKISWNSGVRNQVKVGDIDDPRQFSDFLEPPLIPTSEESLPN